jgi:hypothetical protein
MSGWDYIMPHRLLVNRSLRKASDNLRLHIDEYQLKYDREIERCTTEIEKAKAEKESAFESVKSSLINELSKDSKLFDKVHEGLITYADLFFQRQCLNRVYELKKVEMQALIEYGDFLTEQMRLIGEEIEILEERKDRLTLQAQVNDVLELLSLSGCDIAIDGNKNAETLLAKVVELIESTEDDDWIKKQSLRALRSILQERVDFLPVIQYITWTIQQKVQLSRQLSIERRKTNEDKKIKASELREVSERIDTLTREMDEQARIVREFWAVPITQLNAQKSYLYLKKNEAYDEYNTVSEKIERIKKQQISDSSWDILWSRKKELRECIIPELKHEIASVNSELKQWYLRREMIYSLCKRNNVFLISDNNEVESDEYRIINNRLAELYRIEEEANKREEERFIFESAQIQKRRKEKIEELTAKIKIAEKNVAEKNYALSQANQQLVDSKDHDKRFFLLKIFAESEEVSKAKITLQIATKQKKEADILLSGLKAELSRAIDKFDKELKDCRPKPYRPTAAESDEREKLEHRKAELLSNPGKRKSVQKEKKDED